MIFILFICVGDSITNGAELGDPCCTWTKGTNTPLLFTEMAQLSHPGESSSMPSMAQLGALRNVNCSTPQVEGGATDLVDTFYAPGEQRTTSMISFKAEIPVQETTYMRYTYNLPSEPAVNYLVGMESIIGY
jgi:hypothetical protein